MSENLYDCISKVVADALENALTRSGAQPASPAESDPHLEVKHFESPKEMFDYLERRFGPAAAEHAAHGCGFNPNDPNESAAPEHAPTLFQKLTKNETLEFQDISDELLRVYTFLDDDGERFDVMVPNPVAVNTTASSSGGHRLINAEGDCIYVPGGWVMFSFKTKEGVRRWAF